MKNTKSNFISLLKHIRTLPPLQVIHLLTTHLQHPTTLLLPFLLDLQDIPLSIPVSMHRSFHFHMHCLLQAAKAAAHPSLERYKDALAEVRLSAGRKGVRKERVSVLGFLVEKVFEVLVTVSRKEIEKVVDRYVSPVGRKEEEYEAVDEMFRSLTQAMKRAVDRRDGVQGVRDGVQGVDGRDALCVRGRDAVGVTDPDAVGVTDPDAVCVTDAGPYTPYTQHIQHTQHTQPGPTQHTQHPPHPTQHPTHTHCFSWVAQTLTKKDFTKTLSFLKSNPQAQHPLLTTLFLLNYPVYKDYAQRIAQLKDPMASKLVEAETDSLLVPNAESLLALVEERPVCREAVVAYLGEVPRSTLMQVLKGNYGLLRGDFVLSEEEHVQLAEVNDEHLLVMHEKGYEVGGLLVNKSDSAIQAFFEGCMKRAIGRGVDVEGVRVGVSDAEGVRGAEGVSDAEGVTHGAHGDGAHTLPYILPAHGSTAPPTAPPSLPHTPSLPTAPSLPCTPSTPPTHTPSHTHNLAVHALHLLKARRLPQNLKPLFLTLTQCTPTCTHSIHTALTLSLLPFLDKPTTLSLLPFLSDQTLPLFLRHLSPQDILTAALSSSINQGLRITTLLFKHKDVLSEQVLLNTLSKAEEGDLPVLFMRTVLLALLSFPGLKKYVLALMFRMVKRRVYLYPTVYEGFVKCLGVLGVNGVEVVAAMPVEYGRGAVRMDERVRRACEGYLERNAKSKRRVNVLKSILEA